METAKRRAYQEKAEAEMRAWSARIEELLAKAEAQKAAGKIEYYDRLEKLRDQRDSLRQQLAELRESGDEAWDEMKEGFEKAHRELSTAFHSAVERFRDDDDAATPLPASSEEGSASASA